MSHHEPPPVEVSPTETNAIPTPFKQPREKGRITNQFTVWCAICGQWEMASATTKDKFIELIDKNWRITPEQGWVHKKCCKMMPTAFKFQKP